MRTNYRLDEVFKKAFPVPFDDTSRYVFFSDIHRGDDSLSDEFGRNRHIYDHALDYYYRYGCTYVEVGDGDELWEHPNYDHIRRAHITTFDLLKKYHSIGKLLMLYGNHNMSLKDPKYVEKHLYQVFDDQLDEMVDLFPGLTVHEALIFKHRNSGQEIFVVHGMQGDLMNDQLWWLSRFLVRYFWRFLHVIGVNYAASPAKNKLKRHRIEKNYNKWNEKHGIMLICGHTHRAKFPRPGEPAYFNTGCCMHPRGISCLELIDGCISYVTWRVHSKPDGTMYIKRTVMQGPTPIEEFQTRDPNREGISEEFKKEKDSVADKLKEKIQDGAENHSRDRERN